ncbi:MAG TPA: rod shape-determining protein RodA [candidate division Zixibacteria bacterium]
MEVLRQRIPSLDWLLVGSTLLLSIIGILLIYTTDASSEQMSPNTLWDKQVIWLTLGLAAFFLAVFVPLRVHEVFAYVYLAIVALVLAILLFGGGGIQGRWISMGAFHVQPSEPAKLAMLFALSRYLAYQKRPPISRRSLLTLSALVGPVWLLVLRQPDLGTSLVFWALLLTMLYWAGAPPLHMFLLVSPLISLILAFNWISWVVFLVVLLFALHFARTGLFTSAGLVVLNILFGIITPLAWNKLLPYQKLRLISFLDPGGDPRGAGYQIIQSKVAIGSGGLWGTGFLEGSQTGLHFLPEKHTDFIFAVAGEQFGLWGTLLILFLFGVFLWRTIEVAHVARSRFARFLAIGAATIVAFQMIVNIGMTVGLMPVTGLPLPFVSYGGSSLISLWFLTGLIANVRRHWQEY